MVRNRLYTEYFSSISSLTEKLNNALDNLPCAKETMEEREIRYALQAAAEKLSNAKYVIEHFLKPTNEGYLKINSHGRFELDEHEFTCGSPIEVYLQEDIEADIEEGWYSGRVEHSSDKGYCFYGPGKPPLHEGMRVRTRE